MPDWITIPEIEELLNTSLSDTFHTFWEFYIPHKVPFFSLRTSALNGPWGQRSYDRQNRQALIKIERDLDAFHKENSLVHEILHLALEWEGWPVIIVSGSELRNLPNRDDIAQSLHSVIVHPVIWSRMREWGFPVDRHIKVKAKGQLKDLESKLERYPYPARSNFSAWCDWLLRYVLARLEWGEPERQAIYDMFESRHIPIGAQGEKYVRRLANLGYFEPETLALSTITKAGKMLLKFIDLGPYFTLAPLFRG